MKTVHREVVGLDRSVRIVRDSFGVPHISASTAADGWFGLGFASAQDRMFQMEYDRRRATGRWAEIAGPQALASDVLARRLGLERAARADLAVMSSATREAFEAYASGVNAAAARHQPPPELRILDIGFEPWEPWHSVAAFKVRHVLMGPWQQKLARAMVLARIGPDAFALLDSRTPAGSPLTVPSDGRVTEVVSAALDDVQLAGTYLGFLREPESGSNAWVVSGTRTTHGAPVICNDSHRALDVPNVYWQAHLTTPSFDVAGATFPGLPGFPHFGFNRSVAWAITHAGADNQDLFFESFDPQRPGWYRRSEGWREAGMRSETIHVRGDAPVTVEVWTTENGSVVHGDPRTGTALSLRYTATDRPGLGFEPLLPMLQAQTVAELFDTQESWVDPVNNLLAADTSGHIGYQTRGELPERASAGARRLPMPGWSSSGSWLGRVRFRDLPRVIDPDSGFVMTANNAIVDGEDPFVTYSFTDPFRAERLRELLTSKERFSTDELAGFQSDTVSWAARAFGEVLDHLGPVGDPDSPAELARLRLAGWDGDLEADGSTALVYGCFRRALARALYLPLLGRETFDWVVSGVLAPTAVLMKRWLANDTWALLGGARPGDWPDEDDRRRVARVREVLPDALAEAWTTAGRFAGDVGEAGGPLWGRWHQALGRHPLAADLAALSDAETDWDWPGVSMGGDGDTVQAASYGWSPTLPFDVTGLSVYRQVVDLGTPSSFTSVIPGGASGDPTSPHYTDQLMQWAVHRRIPLSGSTPDPLKDEEVRLEP